jgi:aquaporin Z
LSLLVMAYVIGPVSGCHLNPAVTLGAALAPVIEVALVPFYVIGQVLGAAFWRDFAANGWLIVDARDATAHVTEVAVGRIEQVTDR